MATQRTAKADFKVGAGGMTVDGEMRPAGTLVKAGQVVMIEAPRRLKNLVTAGVVEAADDDDAAVPKLQTGTAAPAKPTAVEVEQAKARAADKRTAANKAAELAEQVKKRTDAADADKTKAIALATEAAQAADAAETEAAAIEKAAA